MNLCKYVTERFPELSRQVAIWNVSNDTSTSVDMELKDGRHYRFSYQDDDNWLLEVM